MKIKVAIGFIVTVALASISGASWASVIDENGVASDIGFISDPDTGTFIANRFTVGVGGVTLRRVTWSGAYSGGNDGTGTNDFTIRIFSSILDEPGILLGTFAVGDITAVDSGVDFSGLDIYEYATNLTALALAAGDYWISIVNDYTIGTSERWRWAGAGSGDGGKFSSTSQTTGFTTSISGSSVFSTNTLAVPEPATIGLLGLGFISLGGLARRRRQQQLN